MFILVEHDDNFQCRELPLEQDVFHKALQDGDKRYCVRNPYGDDFDIQYLDNNDDIESIEMYPKYVKGPFMAKYTYYDETDQSTLYMAFL